jgi:hypothetical protein
MALQGFHVAFLFLHDWVPLGRLNNLEGVRRAVTRAQLVAGTLISGTPFALGLAFSLWFRGGPPATWLRTWLWVSYGLLFVGELQAWWVPYLLRPEPQRAARYQQMFDGTLAFLPRRHGIVPNTLHVALHLATLATLLLIPCL